MRKLYIFLFPLVLLFAACDTVDSTDVETEYFVESYQIAGQPIKPVRLSRTADVDAAWYYDLQAIRGAIVNILLLKEDGSVEKTYLLTENATKPGLYESSSTDVVLPLRTYRLEVSFADNSDRVTAQTVVPGNFDITHTNADSLVYQGPEQFEVHVTRSSYPGRDAIYIFVDEVLDLREEQMTPVLKDIFDNDDDLELEDFRLNSSTPLNEANYDVNPDNTLRLKLPWLMVLFYGPQKIHMNAIDNNLYDFQRSYMVQSGQSNLPPGEIPNIIDHVEGGTGVFGSYAAKEYHFYVERGPELPQ